eukprot:scaffold15305_cov116-Isochrysis_galbana.AAC.6
MRHAARRRAAVDCAAARRLAPDAGIGRGLADCRLPAAFCMWEEPQSWRHFLRGRVETQPGDSGRYSRSLCQVKHFSV